jgi:Fic family protein
MNEINNHAEIVKMRNELEEIKEELYDRWHDDKERYLKRIDKALDNNKLRVKIFLAIDGIRSVKEIEAEIKSSHAGIWRAFQHLFKEGIVRKIGSKSGSPIYAKKPWVKSLRIDDYVKEKYQEKPAIESTF